MPVGFLSVRQVFGFGDFAGAGVVHLHALLRLDGVDPADEDRIIPPVGVVLKDLIDAVQRAAAATTFVTEEHPDGGWRISWGEQLDVRPLRLRGDYDVTDRAFVAYLAKYATKSTESTGHVSKRLTGAASAARAAEQGREGPAQDGCAARDSNPEPAD